MLTTYYSPTRSLVSLLAAVALAACTTPGDTTDHSAHPPDQTTGSTARSGCGTMMGGQAGGGMMAGQPGTGMMGGTSACQTKAGPMDPNQMCAMYRNMQSAPMEQRQAMMDQQMKGMSPEMRQQHMEMMRQQCK